MNKNTCGCLNAGCVVCETYFFDRARADIAAERRRQENKWGQQNHEPFTYLAILGEEVGEANQAALHAFFPGRVWEPGLIAHLREELVQVAAVAQAIVECIDRDKWPR